ncbi:MAG: phosphate acyltransferase PlsX [Candidatus Zixiibacteriota bacterium]
MTYYTKKVAQQWDQELENRKRPVVIVLDAMGGDGGPKNNIDGAIEAISEAEDLKIKLVGQRPKIKEVIGKRFLPPEIEIVHADEVVGMGDKATKAIRNSDNSITKGLELVWKKKADGFVSMGNTGAVVASSLIGLGRIGGILRPALMTPFPTELKKPALVLDVGASVDCKPEHLYQFAIMGSVYAEKVLLRKNPKVALLSIGEEPGKGNAVVKKTYKMLSNTDLNFIGNIESRDIISGKADIIVCDGFIGNTLLKFAESTFKHLKKAFMKGKALSFRLVFGGFMLLPTIVGMMRDYDYREYGGAPLMGVRGNVIIGHGRSTPKAIKNAILLAQKMALGNLEKAIHEKLEMEKPDA